MKKFATVALIVVALALIGGALVYSFRDQTTETQNSVETSSSESMTTPEMNEVDAQPEAQTQEQTVPAPTPETATQEVQATPASRYVTLAEFNAGRQTYSGQRKVYFFHAPWCPICKAIEEDIESDPSQIPANTTFIKVDYDSNTSMRQKYGVTYQYTFVQVDNNDAEVKQWSATTLDKAIAGLQ